MGNTYDMQQQSQYETQIAKAMSYGFDGFALNVGADEWGPNRLALMFAAAKNYPAFKLYINLDMAVLAGQDHTYLYPFILNYKSDSSYYLVGGKQFVGTFAGENYNGNQADPPKYWAYFKSYLASQGSNIYFVPAFTGYGFQAMGWDALDGALSWNAWTKDTAEDNNYLMARDSATNGNKAAVKTGDYRLTTAGNPGTQADYSGKTYMAGIGPLLFTHYDSKNFMFSNDDLYTVRWENLLTENPDFIQVISWNDYGESHYLDDQSGAKYVENGVSASQWIGPNYDHTTLGPLHQYYISAYKNGVRPAITTNRVFMWYRPHSFNAVASNDPNKPTCGQYTRTLCPADNVYVTVLFNGAYSATAVVTSGGASTTQVLQPGINTFNVAFSEGNPTIVIKQGTTNVLSQTGTLAISNTIQKYNFNLHIEQYTFQ